MTEDTIIAISTPPGYGGIGIVRLSGKKSLPIAKKIFRPYKLRTTIPGRLSLLGRLFDFEKGEPFEEAFLTYFPAPRTYTKEDVIEISCHGSPVILEEAVRLGIKAGARPAHPGEFTLRAYLNGRLDILQAEAINDIIQAASFRQAKLSYKQLEGSLSRRMSAFRDQIIRILSRVEATLEFPEEGLGTSPAEIQSLLKETLYSVQKLILSYDLGKALREGISLAIIGRANVGKSTLFNSLLEDERAIVTPFPGTTRDYLKEKIKIEDAIFTLIDTAGLGRTTHPADSESIKRSQRLAWDSDGVLLVLDASQPETAEDLELIKKLGSKKMILVFNKIDLPLKMNTEKVKNFRKALPQQEISALNQINLERLKRMIKEYFISEPGKEDEVILHLRQKLILEDIQKALSAGLELLNQGYSEEIYIEEIRKAIPLIGQLTGEIQTDEIIQDIFSQFCVGK